MSAARKLYTFGPRLALCEPARRIVDPTPAEVLDYAFTRRPDARHNRGRIATQRTPSPTTIVTSVPFVGYWDAEFGVTTGATLTWLDRSGNGNTLTQATAANQATYSAADAGMNSQPAFTFDGTNDEFVSSISIPAPGTTPRFYYFVIQQVTWPGAANRMLFSASGGACQVIYQPSTGASPQVGMYNTTLVNINSGAAVGSTKRGMVSFTNSISDRMQLGSSNVTGANAGNASSGVWCIGSQSGVGFCNFKLGLVFITSGEPTTAELAAVDSYCVRRFGAGILT